LGVSQPFQSWPSREFVDARRSPRYRLETKVRVYARNRAVVRGDSVDISESGLAAMLREEIRLNEVVRLEFTLPEGEVEVLALVRQRNAFRYGFEFIEKGQARDVINRTCRDLAVEQSLCDSRINNVVPSSKTKAGKDRRMDQ
jgi:hypothetical protein